MKFKRIEINLHKQQGRPCIKGTRITVYDILDYLNSGMNTKQIILEYPPLCKEDIYEAVQFIKFMHANTTYLRIESATA